MRTLHIRLAPLFLITVLCASACNFTGAPPSGTETPLPTGKALSSAEVDALWTPLPLARFEHPSGRFAISYPVGWTVSTDDESITFYNQEQTLVIFAQAGSEPPPGGIKYMDAYINGYFSDASPVNKHFPQPILDKPLTNMERLGEVVQSDGSILVKYAFNSGNVRGFGNSFFEQSGETVYILTFLAFDAKLWDPLLPTFAQVSDSLERFR